MYDTKDIERRTRNNKRKFLVRFVIISALLILSVLLMLLGISKVANLISFVAFNVLIILTSRIIEKYHPAILFSKEIRGVNVKEDEYVSRSASGPGMKWYAAGDRRPHPQPFAPNTGANKKQSHPRLRGRVYLRLEDGNVAEISGLSKAHVDLYEEGDTLIRYAGTKYPVILGRSVEKQPCPICGEMNKMTSSAQCHSCGLGIISDLT